MKKNEEDKYSTTWLISSYDIKKVPLVAQMVKNTAAKQETQVQFLGQEDPLGEGMATRFSTLAWGIPWTEEPGGLQTSGSQRVRHN